MRKFSTGLIAAVLLQGTSSLYADLPAIRFDRLTVLGTSAGTEVEAEILGADIEDVKTLLFEHTGITAEPIPDKERRFQIKVAADVPVGTYDVYLVGRFGVSNPRLFAVTKGFQEVADNGQNLSVGQAQPLEINSAVNGTINGNAQDFYRFSAKAGDRLAIDCQAQRLDSELDANLALLNSSGAPIASNADTYGLDPFLDVIIPADGEYTIALNDLSYRGGYPYRLCLTDRPRIESIFPAAVQAGQNVTFEVLGSNLTSAGGQPSPWESEGMPLDEMSWQTTIPADVLVLGQYSFQSHPTYHSVLPTAATCTLTGLQVIPPQIEGLWDRQPILVVDVPVTLEAEPNDTPESPQPFSLPIVVAGRFQQLQDADWFEFTCPENGQYDFDVYCERIAGGADAYLIVMDDQGNRINELDDYGHRVNAFDGHLRDPSQAVNLSKDRKYRILVQDRYRRGGARYRYVLEVRPSKPDFYAAVIHSSNPNPAGTTLFKGTAGYMDVVLHQKGGYNGEVTIEAEGLPAGVQCAPATINNNSRGTLVFWAEDSAADWSGFIKLFATSERDGEPFRREVRYYSRVWNNSGTSRPSRQLALAVREQGPFDLEIQPGEIQVESGKTADLKLSLRRLWPDFKDKVTIQPLSFPGNFKSGNFDIGKDQTEAELKIEVQQNTRPGRYTLTVLGQAQVP
ncbi:MAG TPA: pre-peptidase C-terminal domain-containing protein, partial [Planctomycetaceae bacterium]|nr:pre-peptidase C-terminal domain-containing protein [Planctomycetaceae bacterium]